MKVKSQSFKLYAGVDLHNESFNVHVIDENERKVDSRKVPTNEEAVRKYFAPFKDQNMKVAVEAGNPTFWYCDILEEMTIESEIVHPLSYSRTSNNKKKDDKRDARNLCFDLKRKNLPDIAVYKPPLIQRELRSLVIHRSQYVNNRVQTVNRSYSFLSGRGVKVKKRSISDSYKGWEIVFAKLNKESQPESISVELRLYYQDFKHFKAQIKDIEDRIHKHIKAHYMSTYKRLITIPGIGPITAACMIGLVGDWSRFKSGKKLSAYFGLVPSHRQTGTRKLKGDGRITKEGSSLMRKYFVQGALSLSRAKTKDAEPLQQWYEDKKRKIGWKKARVALVRKVCEISFAMIRDGVDFDPSLVIKNSKPVR